MATKKTAQVEEAPKVEAPKGMRPNDLAKELGLKDGKRVRAFLRQEFPRDAGVKNSSWYLNDKEVEAVKQHFAPKSEDSDES